MTGGAGFIGSNFVRHVLARTTTSVLVLDALTYAGDRANLAGLEGEERFTFVQADIAEGEALTRLFGQRRPSAIVNFAAETHVDRSIDGPRAFVRTNLLGTFELLQAARRLHTEVGDAFRFLHVSTDEVYGSLGPEGAFSESSPYAPNSPYAATKAGADHLVRAWHATYGLPALVTNCSNNFGPYQHPEKLIPHMLLNAVEGKPLPLYGDGRQVRDWLYVEDHCAGLLAALEHGRPGETYNLGADQERTNVEVVDALCAALEAQRPAAKNAALAAAGVARYLDLKAHVDDRPGHDRRYAIDATKAREELGWTPQHDFEAGLAATVRWYLENESWCRHIQAKGYRRERLGLEGAQPRSTIAEGEVS